MSLLKFPGYFFTEVVPTMFDGSALKTDPDTPIYQYSVGNGLHVFTLDGCQFCSDSAEELVEIAIREIERSVSALIAHNGVPYVTFRLNCGPDGPSIEFYDAFTVLERPYRIELYTDTFRRGVSRLRALSNG